MPKYVFILHGGREKIHKNRVQPLTKAWDKWFRSIESKCIDRGGPLGVSTIVTQDDGVIYGGGPDLASGYSIIDAANLEEAVKVAQRCPILATGGRIELAEAIDFPSFSEWAKY